MASVLSCELLTGGAVAPSAVVAQVCDARSDCRSSPTAAALPVGVKHGRHLAKRADAALSSATRLHAPSRKNAILTSSTPLSSDANLMHAYCSFADITPLLAASKSSTSNARLSKQSRSVVAMAGAAAAAEPKKILMLGGTRFIGVFLARLLIQSGHEVTLLTRGKSPIAKQIPGETDEEFAEYQSKVKHLKADRSDVPTITSLLQGSGFQVVYDINGREASDADHILDALPGLEQYIFCSSAGVYLKSDLLPHREIDAGDPKSRHKGKLDTETLLQSRGVRWTSLRPVYIYGPLNYNPVEEWFFHRLKAGRPIPVPSSGMQITQLGHVKDLAQAFALCLGNEKAIGQIYNISGEKYVTFDGIARACAQAMGLPPPEIVHYNPKDFDFGKKKSFPLRDQHFFTSIEKAKQDLGWAPEFGLVEGLRNSYELDFGRGAFRKEPDFSVDDEILAKVRTKTAIPV